MKQATPRTCRCSPAERHGATRESAIDRLTGIATRERDGHPESGTGTQAGLRVRRRDDYELLGLLVGILLILLVLAVTLGAGLQLT